MKRKTETGGGWTKVIMLLAYLLIVVGGSGYVLYLVIRALLKYLGE